MIEYRSEFFETDEVRLNYYRTGGSKPSLILAHGVTDDGLCWPLLAANLAADFDLVMVDAPGHGKSSDPKNGFTMQGLAAALANLARGLNLHNPIFLGHSMGAITVLTMAGLYPDLPRAIILEDPPTFWRFVPGQQGEAEQSLVRWMESNKRKTYQDLLAEARNNPSWAEEEIEPWINSKHRYSPNASQMIRLPDLVSLDYPHLLKQVSCAALVLHAEPSLGAILTEEDITELKSFIPQLQSAYIPGAGHSIHREAYGAYLNVLRRFLSQLG